MNITEEREKEIKSQRERELAELRSKGVAHARKTKLQELVGKPLTTPEEARMFLAVMRDESRRKEEFDHKAPNHVSADGMDAWYMMQRNRDKEMRKRRLEAEQLLRGYRGPYFTGEDSPAWSPRAHRTPRHSFGLGLSESLVDPQTEKRRQTMMPRIEHHFDAEEDVQPEKQNQPRHSLAPERTQQYDDWAAAQSDNRSVHSGHGCHAGRTILRDNHEEPIEQETREPSATADQSAYIDASHSHVGRLSEFSGRSRKSLHSTECRDRDDGVSVLTIHTHAAGSVHTHAADSAVSFPNEKEVPETIWRDFISPEPDAKFQPEAGRYHLYASYACPGSHRALIVRALKGLEDIISVTIVHPTWRHTNRQNTKDKHRGWVFADPNGKPFHNTTGRGGPFPPAYDDNEPDPVLGAYSVRELYEHAGDNSGKYTIPLLWDKKLGTIVNNESSDISYMLNSCFNDFSSNPELDLYTEDDEEGLDKLNEVSQWLYPMMIHGVYRCGFAKTQKAYDHAIEELTAAFDMADEILQAQRYLTGDTLTDADIRLFVTLLRFDEVYAFYFRANTRLVMLTPALLNFCREIYQMPGIAETCRMDQIKAHFFGSHAEWNKYSVIPRGLGFMRLLDLPHDRDRLESN